MKILIVDDDHTFILILKRYLEKHDFKVTATHSLQQAMGLGNPDAFDAWLLDYRLPDGTGLDLLKHFLNQGAKKPAIIMTGFNDVKTAVTAIRMGAYDYITKPVNQEELIMVLKQAITSESAPEKELSNPILPPFVKGVGKNYKKLEEQIELIAPTPMSAIIEGESGTGKEYMARMIHSLSKRCDKPFVAIDCGTLTKDLASSELFGHVKGAFTGALQNKTGKLELANGGTLFLDEIGNLGYEIQVKLLRVLQERAIQPIGSNEVIKTDVRIIAATNDDLLRSVQKGNFREDLYHRLNEFKIRIPPLRERKEDFLLFVAFFLDQSNQLLDRQVEDLSPEVWELINNYEWPGNIREMKNIVKRMVLLTPGKIAGIESLPEEMFLFSKSDLPIEENDLKIQQEVMEKEMIEQVLAKVKFNKTKAAKLLNIDRSTLYAKIEKLQIKS